MKEATDTNEFDNILDAVDYSTEQDAKALLKITYGFFDTGMTEMVGIK